MPCCSREEGSRVDLQGLPLLDIEMEPEAALGEVSEQGPHDGKGRRASGRASGGRRLEQAVEGASPVGQFLEQVRGWCCCCAMAGRGGREQGRR